MKFEINWTKIKGGCQSGRKVATHYSKSDLPLRPYSCESTSKHLCTYIILRERILRAHCDNHENFLKGKTGYQSKGFVVDFEIILDNSEKNT